jgi:hypothetical protein
MPNWCDLDVDIEGSKEVLEKILEKGSEGTFTVGSNWNKEIMNYESFEKKPNVFSFDNFHPTPKDLLDGEGWHAWRVENWGTKWDLDQEGAVSLSEITPIGNEKFSFGIGASTAWGPALELFRKLSEDYGVKVIYQYAEEGMAFFGKAIIENGVIISDGYREITSEDYKIAGATLDEDGNVDWDRTDEYDLYKAL